MDPNEWRRNKYAKDPDYRAKCNAQSAAWNKANRELLNARRLVKHRTDPEFRLKEQTASWRYQWRKRGFPSITAEYDRMFAEQKGLCAICQQKSERRLCVDHCDVTKMLRQLLCHACNTALGLLRHNSSWLRRGGVYIDMWRKMHKAALRPRPAAVAGKRRQLNPSASIRGPAPAAGKAGVKSCRPPTPARKREPSKPKKTKTVGAQAISPPIRSRAVKGGKRQGAPRAGKSRASTKSAR